MEEKKRGEEIDERWKIFYCFQPSMIFPNSLRMREDGGEMKK
jgi:hypothetical protein